MIYISRRDLSVVVVGLMCYSATDSTTHWQRGEPEQAPQMWRGGAISVSSRVSACYLRTVMQYSWLFIESDRAVTLN